MPRLEGFKKRENHIYSIKIYKTTTYQVILHLFIHLHPNIIPVARNSNKQCATKFLDTSFFNFTIKITKSFNCLLKQPYHHNFLHKAKVFIIYCAISSIPNDFPLKREGWYLPHISPQNHWHFKQIIFNRDSIS